MKSCTPVKSLSEDASAAADDAAPARLALTLQATVLDAGSLQQACEACARELAKAFVADRVSIALARRRELRLWAMSDGGSTRGGGAAHAGVLSALAETFDQAATVTWPEAGGCAGEVPRICVAHAALVATGGHAVGMPLAASGQVVGAWCLERRTAQQPFSAEDLRRLESLAALVAPVLALMQRDAWTWRERIVHAVHAWWQPASDPHRRVVRRASVAAAMGVALALLVPVEFTVGGQARLEGAVQRVVAAPSDGYLQQVHVRPGERVRAGQVLVELADQDLQLERQRWESQLAQHLDAYAAAQARADRVQLVVHQSKADEAQAQLELVQEKLQRSRLAAPFDGVVVQGDLSQQLGAPVKLGSELMTLAPTDRYRVIVQVDERDISFVQAGQSGTLALTALPWDTLPLRLVRVSPVATAVEGRNVFDVEAELSAADATRLRPGLQGSAHIAAGRASTAWRWSRRLVDTARLVAWEWWG